MDIIPIDQLIGVEYTRFNEPCVYRIIDIYSKSVKIKDTSNNATFSLTFEELWDDSRQRIVDFSITYSLWI